MHKIAIIDIIEDDQPISQMYKTKFESEGFTVFTAANGVQGLQTIEQHRPDVVLLDLMMPEMAGDTMLTKLRKTDWGKHIKVIIMTNLSQEEASKKVNELGVNGFIVKAQTTPQEVVETIKKLLNENLR